MTPVQMQKIYAQHWQAGYGSITIFELAYIQRWIRKLRPTRILEIGTASGLSAALIAQAMDDANITGELHTLDHDDTFFGDSTKPNGFMIEQLYAGARVSIHQHKFKRSLDLDQMELGQFDMALIDASHLHPYPLIDTMFVRPHLTGPKIVLHHDLNLYALQQVPTGVGPKYLWDQIPDAWRERGEFEADNTFAMDLTMPDETFSALFGSGIILPWTTRLGPMVVHRARQVAIATLSSDALLHLNRGIERFNQADKVA